MQRKLLEIISVEFDATGTDRTFCIRQILETKWEYQEAGHQLFTDIKKAYDSVSREVLYNILILFVIPVKLVI